MTKDDAIALASRHASEWGAPWGNVTRVDKERAWWLLFGVRYYWLTIESDAGSALVYVDAFHKKLLSFEFTPRDGTSWMLPLWGAYPYYNSVTIGWRMSGGEAYRYAWEAWWQSLSPDEWARYRERYPEPDWGAWPGFYDGKVNGRAAVSPAAQRADL